jgi:hypothetical protein
MPQCRGIYKSSVKENGIVSLKNEWKASKKCWEAKLVKIHPEGP